MTGKALLDTNVVIALFADEVSIKHQLAIVSEIFIPSIVLGELDYGLVSPPVSSKISPVLMSLLLTI